MLPCSHDIVTSELEITKNKLKMNSKSGAIPKKSQSFRRFRLPSSESEDGIEGNKARDVIFYKAGNMSSNLKKLSHLELDEDSLDINEGHFANGNAIGNSTAGIKITKRAASMNSQFEPSEYDIETNDSDEMTMAELNEQLKKFTEENIYSQLNDMLKTSQSATEVGRAAMAVVQTKSNNNVDMTHGASNQLTKNICKFQGHVTITSAPKVTLKTKPLLKNSNIAKTSAAVSKQVRITTRKMDENKRENQIVDNRFRTAIASSRGPMKSNIVTRSAKLELASISNKRVINKTSTSLSGYHAPATKKVILTNTTRVIKSVSSRNPVKKPNTKPLEVINEEPPISYNISHRKSLNLFPECPVCFERLLLNNPTVATSCGHMYCRECIDAIQIHSNKCPMCRVEITQIIELHL